MKTLICHDKMYVMSTVIHTESCQRLLAWGIWCVCVFYRMSFMLCMYTYTYMYRALQCEMSYYLYTYLKNVGSLWTLFIDINRQNNHGRCTSYMDIHININSTQIVYVLPDVEPTTFCTLAEHFTNWSILLEDYYHYYYYCCCS